jgi:hypothetical protein
MGARLIPGACLRIAATGCDWSAQEMTAANTFSEPILAALSAIDRFPAHPEIRAF